MCVCVCERERERVCVFVMFVAKTSLCRGLYHVLCNAMSNHFLQNIIICPNQSYCLFFYHSNLELPHPYHHMIQSKIVLISRSIPSHYNLFVLESTFIPPNNLLAASSHPRKSKCKYANVIGLQRMKVVSIGRLVESLCNA